MTRPIEHLHLASLFLVLSGSAAAQTGPWQDGEILLTAPGVNPATAEALWRIDPLTGHGEQFLKSYTHGTYWGRLAFDDYRGGFVTCMGLPPDAPFQTKIWLLRHDGSAEHLPGFEGQFLDAFCPTGDGRVFFQVHGGSPAPIHWIDAHGAAHTLLDTGGSVPLDFRVEHMLYHAPSNSLIATTSPWWSQHHCTTGGPSAFRIPLSPDGTKVGGPILCSTWAGPFHNLMSLDWLPNGKVLAVAGTGACCQVNRMLEIDPWTAGISAWADPQWQDLNGGLWSDLLGLAVVLDDWPPDTLRTYSAGESGAGGVLATDVVLDNGSSGYSPTEAIWEARVVTGDGNYCSTGPNSTGKAAHMSYRGSRSIAASDLELRAGPVPDGPYLFIYGPGKASQPFGNGTLCIGGGVKRILPGGSATGSVASVTPDLVALQLTPGAWHFQCWFRDTAAGGAMFDLSDASQVTLVP
jgi:hypothetical protein